MQKKIIRIFVSYSTSDRTLREKLVAGLESHLAHRPNYQYTFWTDQEISVGDDWEKNIQRSSKECEAALLLVDAGFVASSFIEEQELPTLLARDRNEFLLIPILLRAYDFSGFERLSGLQFFKTYYNEYELEINPHELLPFDELGEGRGISDRQLNKYYKKLSDYIQLAVTKKFPFPK